MSKQTLLYELSRGVWAMSIEGLQFWGPIANKIMTGEPFTLNNDKEVKSLISYVDENGDAVRRKEDGTMQVPPGSIAIVDMIGAMIKYGDWCTYGSLEIVEALKAADNNPNIIGTVLNIDGPGGSVSAISPFVDFGLTKKKPVVGLYDQCCSAHLYSMLSCVDHVMASNNISATIGSVGVVLSWADNKKMLEKLGWEFHEVYPAESETKNEAFRLAMEGKYDLIKKEMLSPLAINFQEAVKKARPMLDLKEPGVITGKTFFADKALEIGFIDSIGSLKQAMQLVTVLSETKRYRN
jgi:protease IV